MFAAQAAAGVHASGLTTANGTTVLDLVAWDHAYWVDGPAAVALGQSSGGTFDLPDEGVGSDDLDTGSHAGGKPTYLPVYDDVDADQDSNGRAVAKFEDGTTDGLGWKVTLTSTITQPYTIVLVSALATFGGGGYRALLNTDTSGTLINSSMSNEQINAGVTLSSATGGTFTDFRLRVAVYDGTDSYLREDGAETMRGDAGTDSLIGVSWGARPDANVNASSRGIGAFLGIYDGELSGPLLTNVENWLIDYYRIA